MSRALAALICIRLDAKRGQWVTVEELAGHVDLSGSQIRSSCEQLRSELNALLLEPIASRCGSSRSSSLLLLGLGQQVLWRVRIQNRQRRTDRIWNVLYNTQAIE